jgi:two-component system, cell cycle sensor histidine kinase and response regulator CckA
MRPAAGTIAFSTIPRSPATADIRCDERPAVHDEIETPASVQGSRTTSEALWTATERLRALEEAAPAGIVALDLNGRVTMWNRAAEQLFGWQAAEVTGRPSPLVPEDWRAHDTALSARVLAGEVVSGIETSRLHKSGSQLTVSLSCGPIRNAEGDVCGTIGVLSDISEAKRLERQFLQAQKMEAFGQLAGGIAHDFNNLLTVIIGFSELAIDRAPTMPELAADMKQVREAGERAAQLTRQLLAFSRKQAWTPHVLDLNEAVADFQKMVRRIVREDIRLQITAAPALRHTKADRGQIDQLLMNLVVNARDAMPRGGELTIATANVTLDAHFVRQHVGAAAGKYVSLTVHDTGCGMTPAVLARIFEPFFTTKAPGKGTGLGLSTVFGLVQQSGGYITVDSEPGAGTTVTTYWPAVTDAVAAATERAPARIGGTETILLVEDESGVRHLIGQVLERNGYTVLYARDADDALAIEARHSGTIDLLVSDMIMPGLSGADLAQRLVTCRPGIQVLFVSGYASREAWELGVGGHKASFLQKPFTPETLARMVRERLDSPANPAAATSTTG